MVELEPEDYLSLIRWFELVFGKKVKSMEDIPQSDKRTYWKLKFLAEDKIKELKQEQLDDDAN
mgnify:FL=1|jgi:hypothetical protein|tara:strand:+ start:304 stop:492 length:189 start_codon:yes stop_codon:yes gene_type:complete